MKSGHRNQCASRSRLFIAYSVIYFVQFIALELPIQISQYVAKYDWQSMHRRSQPEAQICLFVVRPSCKAQSVSFIIHNLATSIVESRGEVNHKRLYLKLSSGSWFLIWAPAPSKMPSSGLRLRNLGCDTRKLQVVTKCSVQATEDDGTSNCYWERSTNSFLVIPCVRVR